MSDDHIGTREEAIARFRAEQATNAALTARVGELEGLLKECLGWHDYADDLNKPIEIRAAYMRARAALNKGECNFAAKDAPKKDAEK